jgi:hypothetical protein
MLYILWNVEYYMYVVRSHLASYACSYRETRKFLKLLLSNSIVNLMGIDGLPGPPVRRNEIAGITGCSVLFCQSVNQ